MESNKLFFSDFTFDIDNYCVIVGGKEIYLTLRQYEYLLLLTENMHKIIAYDLFFEKIYKYEVDVDRPALSAMIHLLRGIIGKHHIITFNKIGYKFVDTQKGGEK